jgi:filamentous hemagglutinin
LYDPVVGQFISADRIIPKVYDPQTLNRFAYTRNNPLKYNDPDGHVYQLAIPAAISAFDYAASTTLGITIGVAIGQFSSDVFFSDTQQDAPGPTINADKQGKHIPGHNNYKPGRSILTHPDPQDVLDKYAGTGTRVGNQEHIDTDGEIGIHIDNKTGEQTKTKRGTIHYDEKGQAHIVPAPAEDPTGDSGEDNTESDTETSETIDGDEHQI